MTDVVEVDGHAAQQGHAPNPQSSAMSTGDYANALAADPAAFIDLPLSTGFKLSRQERDRIAIAGLRARFAALRPQIAVLDRMATDQGVSEIGTIEDAAVLLFPHTIYKSYPMSVLERGQFDRLTRWLQGVTVFNLDGFSADGIETIDQWIIALNDRVGLQLVHTSGTTGKLSFLPRARSDQDKRLQIMALSVRDWNGQHSGPDMLANPRPVIYPSYRSGGSTPNRTIDSMARLIARGESNVLTMYPGYFSADLASLAGRLRVAEARGELGSLRISPALMAQREEAAKLERERDGMIERFFADAEARFAGQDVVILGVDAMLYDWAEKGMARGMNNLFGPNSVLISGGGRKGRDLPEDYRAQTEAFLGHPAVLRNYGMSEMTGFSRLCEHGNYHVPPYIVPYVLDPDTGAQLPRSGRQTGRFGYVDLFPTDHWGGFLTGDRVTVAGWDEPCACGRTGPYVEPTIERFSELQGGDDKITCAGAPAAHDQALHYLASIAN